MSVSNASMDQCTPLLFQHNLSVGIFVGVDEHLRLYTQGQHIILKKYVVWSEWDNLYTTRNFREKEIAISEKEAVEQCSSHQKCRAVLDSLLHLGFKLQESSSLTHGV